MARALRMKLARALGLNVRRSKPMEVYIATRLHDRPVGLSLSPQFYPTLRLALGAGGMITGRPWETTGQRATGTDLRTLECIVAGTSRLTMIATRVIRPSTSRFCGIWE
jgi:hypothetical protein